MSTTCTVPLLLFWIEPSHALPLAFGVDVITNTSFDASVSQPPPTTFLPVGQKAAAEGDRAAVGRFVIVELTAGSR